MAKQEAAGEVYSFTTAAAIRRHHHHRHHLLLRRHHLPSPPPPPPPSGALDVVMHAADATRIAGAWVLEADSTAASGKKIRHANAGGAKLAAPVATPSNYFELTFTADAGRPYRLWIRGKADNNSYANDSVFVQFSDSVDAADAATYRIGTTTATEFNLEACSGCGLSGWGWEDNGWGPNILGPRIYFAASGSHTVRIQTREDGLAIDQVVLSPERYLSTSPGATKNDAVILAKAAAARHATAATATVWRDRASRRNNVDGCRQLDEGERRDRGEWAAALQPQRRCRQGGDRAGQSGDILRVDVQRGRRQTVSAVASRPGRQQQLRERFGAPAVLGQRQRLRHGGLPDRHRDLDRVQPRGLQRMRAVELGLGGQRLGHRRARAGDLFRGERPTEGFGCSRARMASRSTRSCCPPPPIERGAGTHENDTTILPKSQ